MVAAAAPVDLSFLTGGYSDAQLPSGTQADPTYLAFLRGMGMDQTEAWSTAVQHIAAVRAQYQTAISRDPQQLHDELRQTNQPYSDGGAWWSGGRLQDVAETQQHDVERRSDLATAQAQGIQGEQDTLRNTLEQLARQNVDQAGALRQRVDAQHSQDEYIRAVASAANPRPAAAPATDPLLTAPGANPAASTPTPAAGGGVQGQLAAMSPAQAAAFRIYTANAPKPPAPPKPVMAAPTQFSRS